VSEDKRESDQGLKVSEPDSDTGFPGAGTEPQRAPSRCATPSKAALPEPEIE
jgi:hypothetical protein